MNYINSSTQNSDIVVTIVVFTDIDGLVVWGQT